MAWRTRNSRRWPPRYLRRNMMCMLIVLGTSTSICTSSAELSSCSSWKISISSSHTLPSARHKFRIRDIEFEIHTASSCTMGHQTSHPPPLFLALDFAPSQEGFMRILFGEVIETGGQCEHIARLIKQTAVARSERVVRTML
ncbi:hypothetical protein KCV03_g140, partial [Aureobasidium melanogenum]